MHVSEARIAANRRNSLRSTGPRDTDKTRGNALKDGLCATVLAQESPELIQEQVEALHFALRPQNKFQAGLIDLAAVDLVRIARCGRVERRARTRVAERAELTWDDDRRLDAEKLGATLAVRGAEVVEALRATPQGCEWLMARWAMLAHVADANDSWDAEQAAMAFELLGTPHAFRTSGPPGTALDFDGRVVGPDDGPAAVARRAVAELRERREAVAELDEAERQRAAGDYADSDPEVRRARRYEATLHNRVRWVVAQVKAETPERERRFDLIPKWVPDRLAELAQAQDQAQTPEPPQPAESIEEPADDASDPPPAGPAEAPPVERKRRPNLDKARARRKPWPKHVDQPLA